MGSRVRLFRPELTLIGVAMAIAVGVLPFSPSAATATQLMPGAQGQVASASTGTC